MSEQEGRTEGKKGRAHESGLSSEHWSMSFNISVGSSRRIWEGPASGAGAELEEEEGVEAKKSGMEEDMARGGGWRDVSFRQKRVVASFQGLALEYPALASDPCRRCETRPMICPPLSRNSCSRYERTRGRDDTQGLACLRFLDRLVWSLLSQASSSIIY